MVKKLTDILFDKKIISNDEIVVNLKLITNRYNINTYHLETNKRKYILKSQNKKDDKLSIQRDIYYHLKPHPLFSVEVYYCDKNICLIEYIENNKTEITINHYELIAKKLADLHLHTSTFFGYNFDTYLGNVLQNNKLNKSWCDFFLNQRYDFYLNKIRKQNYLSSALLHKLLSFRDCIKDRLLEPNQPGLIHGDIWLENILIKGNQVCKIIDPAIFYSDPEYELAYIYLNGTFAKGFYERYNYYNPISKEFWNYKIYLYQIIPLMQYTLMNSPIYLIEIEKLVNFINKN
ncbi:MAG: fructosamine kinase family protein [Hyphomicrobiales bacterium]|jgi:fructosamine-3-kinase|nr:fructosamine kinase family protein [Hyphomicrobiales bacterium]